MPHLDYIKREGRYQKDASEQDLILTKSGNMPAFAQNDDRVFWESCAARDKRSYREIEFALPNELSHEEQIQLVEAFIQEVIPNNPYTYAIHEVDSAVHGVKNPHCHLMFSERLMNPTVAIMSKNEFFKQRGKTRYGTEFGGSVKDRSWAGRGKTAKYYEVRKTLADFINKAYEKNGLSIRVDHRSLEDQSADYLTKGDMESAGSHTVSQRRINERVFKTHAATIKEAINNEEAPVKGLPIRIQERIIHERLRKLDRQIQELTEAFNATLAPKQEHRDYALHTVNAETKPFIDLYINPFNYLRNKLDRATSIAEDVPAGQPADSPITNEIAYRDEKEMQERFFVTHDLPKPELIIADLELMKETLSKEIKAATVTKMDSLLAVMTDSERAQLLQFNKDMNLAKNRLNIARELELPVDNKLEVIHSAGQKVKAIYEQYYTDDIKKEAKELQAADNKRRHFYRPKSMTQYEELAVRQELGYNPFLSVSRSLRAICDALDDSPKMDLSNDASGRSQSLKREYEELQQKYITPEIKEKALKLKEEHKKMYKKLERKPLRAYEEKLLNQVTDGEFYKQKNLMNKVARDLRAVLKSEAVERTSSSATSYIKHYQEDFLSDMALKYKEPAERYFDSLAARKMRLQAALDKTESLLAVAKAYVNVSEKAVKETKETLKRVANKHRSAKETIKQKTKEAVAAKTEAIRKFKNLSRPLSYYEDKLLDEATGGALNRYKEKLRSKESIRNYQLKTNADTTIVDKEIAAMKESIDALRKEYMTPTIRAEAKRLYDEARRKRKPMNYKKEKRELKAIIRKRNVSSGTKTAAKELTKALSNMFTRSESEQTVSANFNISANTDNEFKKFHF